MKNIDFPYDIDLRGRTAIVEDYDDIRDFYRWGRQALTGYEKHIVDMIEQLLFTTPGERVNRPDFGFLATFGDLGWGEGRGQKAEGRSKKKEEGRSGII